MSDNEPQWVEVYNGYDRLKAEMLRDHLRSEGVRVWLVGMTNPALAGLGAFAASQRIRVPVEHVEQARALLQAWSKPPGPVSA
ncbi:MAG: putative signal transducing protein [Polyangiales bacterium]